MFDFFQREIDAALGRDLSATVECHLHGNGDLASCFQTADLAQATTLAAASEYAALIGARSVDLDRRRASLWFRRTVQPICWELPSVWNPVSGNYQTKDGWIRLHTNAPHHLAAALSVLDCPADPAAVAKEVAKWRGADLEAAIVAAKGCAAEMRSIEAWQQHPQGRAVAKEPLIDWRQVGEVKAAANIAPATLKGLKVLDLTRVLAGPVSTRFLAGYGADVLRIDPPHWNEPGAEVEVTLGKRCAGLDLTRTEDRRVFEALLTGADIFVHGYRPGALESLGYDQNKLRRLNPEMIEAALCAYGRTGPWQARRGFDSLVQMSCGIAQEGMVRFEQDKPTPLPVQALDFGTGYLLAASILRALRMKRASGAVYSARLSLARTAALLVSGGTVAPTDGIDGLTEQDLGAEIEATGWGPARRVIAPFSIDGQKPVWSRPAGPLRQSEAKW
jgi:crotonobetainyl-CoA:carnitine CoA-transferase CaiB-like acyl-CoA transferase